MVMAKARLFWRRALAAAWILLAAPLAVAAADEPIVIPLDHAEILRLAAPARRVIVGNPALADVTVDSPTLLSLFGKIAGETNLIVLDARDRTLLSRPLIVTRATDRAVAVHVPGKDGPTERLYSCGDSHCQRLKPVEDAPPAAVAAPPAAVAAPAR
jgi:hypothetical protein